MIRFSISMQPSSPLSRMAQDDLIAAGRQVMTTNGLKLGNLEIEHEEENNFFGYIEAEKTDVGREWAMRVDEIALRTNGKEYLVMEGEGVKVYLHGTD